MQCPKCGHDNVAPAKFCGGCGTKLEWQCPNCNSSNPLANKFCSSCGQPVAFPTTGLFLSGQTSTGPSTRDERRWVTVLFADLSGFTARSEHMDPEDVKALAHRCAEQMSEEVRRFGGTVLAVAGDQVFAVFGAPVAHEDDPERAIRAGLAIRDCQLSDDPERAIQVHVGINTGDVMAGLVGPQERCDYTVMGDTVNVAARLMSAAPSGSVLVGEETRRATRRVVEYRELPPLTLKGKEQPVPAWEALAAAHAPQARPLGTAPLFGRDEELGLLSGIWLKVVREARPHLVTVLGDPGLGKSRLIAEFERRVLSASDATVLHGRCLPYGEALGYWALASVLKEAAHITSEHSVEAARAKLEELVTEAIGLNAEELSAQEIARHLALLAGMDVAADRAATAADQRALHASVRRLFEALARRKPLCVLFDDIHWADGALLDLIEFVASRAKGVPLLMMTQARPDLLEKRANWGGGVRAFTSLPLEPLEDRAARELIRALCREHELAEDVAEQIGRGAAGNPLFAEELVAMIAERGIGAGVPSAIKALIAARLDTLPLPERSVLQVAAVFGKSFWDGGLRALGFSSDLATLLEALQEKELVHAVSRSQFSGEREYVFKHDLIRDVAYEMLPRAERKVLHGHTAGWIEQAAGGQIEIYLDQLAHHALKANQEERALDYLVRAAERARRMAAHRQEAALLAQAIAIAQQLKRPELMTELRVKRGRAFMSVSIWAEARPELEGALQLLSPKLVEKRAEVMLDLAGACFWMFDMPESRQYATQAQELATEANRDDLVAVSIGWLGASEQSDGNMISARDFYRRALARDPDIAAAPMALYSIHLYLVGETAESVAIGRTGLGRFRERNETSNTMFVYPHLGLALAASGRYDEALKVFDEARRFGHEHEVWPFLARSIAMSAGFHLDLFDFEGNERIAREALEMARSGSFLPTTVSAGIDLWVNYARRQEISRADSLSAEVARTALEVGGWHAWVWEIRIGQARAELALARSDWRVAIDAASPAIQRSQATSRIKYQTLGLWTRARALQGLGRTHDAIGDLTHAVELARRLDDPALFLRVASALLGIAGDDALLAETRATVTRIVGSLSDEPMRRCFEEAEPVRRISKV